jgi:hypothetical protein
VGDDSVGHFEMKISHELVSNSDWLPRCSCLSVLYESDLRMCMEVDGEIFEHSL